MFTTLGSMDTANVVFVCAIVVVNALLALAICIYKCSTRSRSQEYGFLQGGSAGRASGGTVPTEFLRDEESLAHLAEEYDYTLLQPEEQIAYLKAEEFSQLTPPRFEDARGSSYKVVDEIAIRDRGLGAFEFEQDPNFLQPRYVVEDRTEVGFIHNEHAFSCATSVMNYSLPVKLRSNDAVYFEVKVFEFDASAFNHFAIGLVTKPYPSTFRLPGYNSFLIAYESTGNLKINNPLPTPLQQHAGEQSLYNAQILPPLQQSDVVGFGYVISTGTIFITHNGRKLMDIMKGCFVDMYAAIGCFQTNAKFQTNIGQLGFVWIEANVRKYGFVALTDYKKVKGDRGLAALPEYANTADKVLDKGEELPPGYPEDELDFFGRSTTALKSGTSAQLEQGNSGTSAAYHDHPISEKEDDTGDEPKFVNDRRSSNITNEPEEIMNLRERAYEQSLRNSADAHDEVRGVEAHSGETQPLLGASNQAPYGVATDPQSLEIKSEASSSGAQSTRETTPNTILPSAGKVEACLKNKNKKKKKGKKKGKKK